MRPRPAEVTLLFCKVAYLSVSPDTQSSCAKPIVSKCPLQGAHDSCVTLDLAGPEMAKALYIVIESRGKWWVDFEGRAHGPHDSVEQAALEARNQAQFMAQMERPSEVLVPDASGKYWVVWSSADAGRGRATPISAGADRSAA